MAIAAVTTVGYLGSFTSPPMIGGLASAIRLELALGEIARVVELGRRLAERVRKPRERGAFPLILAGNCNSCLGTVAGIGPDGLGVVWFDARADFDTPEDVEPGPVDRGALRRQLDELRAAVDRVYLHVDLDALDSGVARANGYAAPGGPTLEALLEGIGYVFERFAVQAAAITSYDPSADGDGSAAAAAQQICEAIARAAAGRRHV